MKYSKYRLRQYVGAAVMLLHWALAGVSGTAVAAGLTIAVSHTPLSLPLYVADSQGYFAAAGVQVTLNDVIGGYRAFQQLADGQADLATASDSLIMFRSFTRNDFAIIASFSTSSKDVSLIAGKALGDARPEHLTGKRIAMVAGSASHYYLDSWLVFHGIDPKSVRPVSLQPETMAAALAKGEVDAVAIWNPYSFDVLKGVPGAKLLPDPGTYTLSFCLIADRKLAGSRDEDLARLLRALLRAEQFIRDEPAKAQAILRERLKLAQDFIDSIWPHYRYRVALEQSLITTLEGEARWARQEGQVTAPRSPNYLGFILAEPLRKAGPERVNIGH